MHSTVVGVHAIHTVHSGDVVMSSIEETINIHPIPLYYEREWTNWDHTKVSHLLHFPPHPTVPWEGMDGLYYKLGM